MEKKKYFAPVLRDILLSQELGFLVSGFGEDAHPGDGQWDDDGNN